MQKLCFLFLSDTCPDPWKEKLKKMYDDKMAGRIKIGPADFLVRRTCDRHYAEYGYYIYLNCCRTTMTFGCQFQYKVKIGDIRKHVREM